MAAITSNTFLALSLSFLFSISSFAFSDKRKINKAFARKNYKKVILVYKKSSRPKRLLKNRKTVLKLAIASEKSKNFNYAYLFYYRKLILEDGKLFRRINKRIQRGKLVDSSRVSKRFKVTSWKVLTNLFSWLKSQKLINTKFNKRLALFNKIGNLLIELEFRDDKTDRLLTAMNYHIEKLAKNKRKIVSYGSFELLTWQREADINKNDGTLNGDLVLTNRGVCIGSGVSYANYYTAYKLDSCLNLSLGNISENSGVGDYQQENVLGYGIKISPGFSFFVSEKRAELGFKFPLLFFIQDLESPPNFTVDGGSNTQFLMSLYSKWPIGKFFISTEFSKFFSNDLTMWSLGFGLEF